MANIVLGIGTSHSPLLAIDTELWVERARDDLRRDQLFLADGRVLSYPELRVEAGDRYAGAATRSNFERQSAAAQRALDRLAGAVAGAALDVLVIIGDDQAELFGTSHMPAFAVFNGAEVVTHPRNEVHPELPRWFQEANKGYLMDTVHRHPGAPELANALIEGLIAAGVDVSVATEVPDPASAGFGHAFGFVLHRLCGGLDVPVLPVLLNTYYPPNVPRPARCYEIGEIIGDVLASAPGGARIGIVASGGLTHFAVDEDLDRTVLGALQTGDADTLRGLHPPGLRSGNSEILNWVMAAGALRSLAVTGCEYIPVHRTPAGTGIGLGFVTWQPNPELR